MEANAFNARNVGSTWPFCLSDSFSTATMLPMFGAMSPSAAAGFRPRIAREVQELTAIMGLVDAGEGVAIVPADTESIKLPGVSYMRLRDESAFSVLYLAYRERDLNAHLHGLLSKLRHNAGTAPSAPTDRGLRHRSVAQVSR